MGQFGFRSRAALFAVALFGGTSSVAVAGIPGSVLVTNRHMTTVITIYINGVEVGKLDGDSSAKFPVGDGPEVKTKLVAKAEVNQVWEETVITPNKGSDHQWFVRPK